MDIHGWYDISEIKKVKEPTDLIVAKRFDKFDERRIRVDMNDGEWVYTQVHKYSSPQFIQMVLDAGYTHWRFMFHAPEE